MGLERALDLLSLKVSGLLASTYISLIIASTQASDRRDLVEKQAFGFVALFFMSLLVYLVL